MKVLRTVEFSTSDWPTRFLREVEVDGQTYAQMAHGQPDQPYNTSTISFDDIVENYRNSTHNWTVSAVRILEFRPEPSQPVEIIDTTDLHHLPNWARFS